MNNTYYQYIFEFTSDIYDLLEKGYSHYNKIVFLQLLHYAKNKYEELQEENKHLQEENKKLKQEIDIININIVSNLERDLAHMRNSLNKAINPKYNIRKTVEQLDV